MLYPVIGISHLPVVVCCCSARTPWRRDEAKEIKRDAVDLPNMVNVVVEPQDADDAVRVEDGQEVVDPLALAAGNANSQENFGLGLNSGLQPMPDPLITKGLPLIEE